MGCDIHGIIEIRYKGKWVGIEEFGERNYKIFSKLADVRNYWSREEYDNLEIRKEVYLDVLDKLENIEDTDENFSNKQTALIETQFNLKEIEKHLESAIIYPIAKPRGVPLDSSDLYNLRVDQYGPDGHSFSWVSFDEMKDLLDEIIPIAYQEHITSCEDIKKIWEDPQLIDSLIPDNLDKLSVPQPINQFTNKWLKDWLGEEGKSLYYRVGNGDERYGQVDTTVLRYNFFFDN
jgi:hypothetical protein